MAGANELSQCRCPAPPIKGCCSPKREVVRHEAGWLALVPITERGDAIGVLEVSLAYEPDATTLDDLVDAAHALAYALIASRRHTDLFEWAQRDTPFSVSAEIQRRLLPSAYTAEAGPLTLAGWLEPASHVGGETRSTTASTATTCTPRSPTPWVTASRPPSSRP